MTKSTGSDQGSDKDAAHTQTVSLIKKLIGTAPCHRRVGQVHLPFVVGTGSTPTRRYGIRRTVWSPSRQVLSGATPLPVVRKVPHRKIARKGGVTDQHEESRGRHSRTAQPRNLSLSMRKPPPWVTKVNWWVSVDVVPSLRVYVRLTVASVAEAFAWNWLTVTAPIVPQKPS